MRLSKIAWFILGGGIFLIAFIFLFVGYSRLSAEEDQVNDDLASAQQLLPQLVAEREELDSTLAQSQAQLTQATLSLSTSKARFPAVAESIEYDEELFSIAHACDLEIVNITASEPLTQEVDEITFTATMFEMAVQSTNPPPDPFTKAYIDNMIADVLTFVNTIVTDGYFDATSIELVKIEAPKSEKEGEKDPTATITLIIYTYQGE